VSAPTPVSSHTIETAYQRLAPLYDSIYGALLQPGRRCAMAALAPQAGERILEVGVGTGFGIADYPPLCRVVGVDLSAPMLARAAVRRRANSLSHVALCRMDALRLAFPDASFDAAYAPYLINVVPDPIQVAREMMRVCRPGGRLVFLNHFAGVLDAGGVVNRLAGRVATWLTAVDWHLDLGEFQRGTGLRIESIEAVNFGGVSAVVVCRLETGEASPAASHG